MQFNIKQNTDNLKRFDIVCGQCVVSLLSGGE